MKNFYFALLFLCSAFSMSAADVTFSVDMNGYTDAFTTVYVSGNFNGWAGDANPLTDEDGDGVWEAIIPLDDGNYDFKFQVDSWAVQENWDTTASCTQAFGDNGEFINRVISVSGDTGACFKWNSCEACEATVVLPNVTFSVVAMEFGKLLFL